MKYKKHIVTGALAISLLVGSYPVFASTPQDLGIKKIQQIYQKQKKNNKKLKIKNKGRESIVGTISMINNTGFIIEIKNIKTNVVSSTDVKTNNLTTYRKNGIKTTTSDLIVGEKVVIVGNLNKTSNTIIAKKVIIVIT